MTVRMSIESFSAELARLGLSATDVCEHITRLNAALKQGAGPKFKIIDTCRLDNGGLLPQSCLVPDANAAGDYIAFVPAAGAASRYAKPLFAVQEALEALAAVANVAESTATSGAQSQLVSRLQSLATEGAAAWPLPQRIKNLLANPERARDLPRTEREALVNDLNLAKARMPCVQEGVSFLAMKHFEHAAIPDLGGEIFVVPPGQKDDFSRHLGDELQDFKRRHPLANAAIDQGAAERLLSRFIEQGPLLSTIRLRRDGDPYRDASGHLSTVPAGHGALARLFPSALADFPAAKGLFIRNIDNVMGTQSSAVAAARGFLGLHRRLTSSVRQIRAAMAGGDWPAARLEADKLLAFIPSTLKASGPGATGDNAPLWRVLQEIFHTQTDQSGGSEELKALFARPVNLLGQVPNTSNDVGGTPCFVEDASGQRKRLKISIEVPHVSDGDKETFLARPERATHFNPAFCAVEPTQDPDYYARRNANMWLMAAKSYRGAEVVYYETVLYELIGNSELANCVFVEIPRLTFNPHKSLTDALGRRLRDWLNGVNL